MSDNRFIMLEPGEVRPGRVPLPPGMAVKARTDDTEGRLSLLEVIVTGEIPRHVHHRTDECVYVLDGELEVEVDDQKYTATKGMFLLLPHSVPHAIRCASEPPPRVLQISSPGGWEHYVEDLIEAGPALMTGGRMDPTKINPIAAKYGVSYEQR